MYNIWHIFNEFIIANYKASTDSFVSVGDVTCIEWKIIKSRIDLPNRLFTSADHYDVYKACSILDQFLFEVEGTKGTRRFYGVVGFFITEERKVVVVFNTVDTKKALYYMKKKRPSIKKKYYTLSQLPEDMNQNISLWERKGDKGEGPPSLIVKGMTLEKKAQDFAIYKLLREVWMNRFLPFHFSDLPFPLLYTIHKEPTKKKIDLIFENVGIDILQVLQTYPIDNNLSLLLKLFIVICETVQKFNDKRLVHCDLKLENIILYIPKNKSLENVVDALYLTHGGETTEDRKEEEGKLYIIDLLSTVADFFPLNLLSDVRIPLQWDPYFCPPEVLTLLNGHRWLHSVHEDAMDLPITVDVTHSYGVDTFSLGLLFLDLLFTPKSYYILFFYILLHEKNYSGICKELWKEDLEDTSFYKPVSNVEHLNQKVSLVCSDSLGIITDTFPCKTRLNEYLCSAHFIETIVCTHSPLPMILYTLDWFRTHKKGTSLIDFLETVLEELTPNELLLKQALGVRVPTTPRKGTTSPMIPWFLSFEEVLKRMKPFGGILRAITHFVPTRRPPLSKVIDSSRTLEVYTRKLSL